LRSTPPAGVQRGWVSGHLYYHQDLDPVVRRFVHPLVAALARDRRIDGFFFVRHGLGGPHLRLRLRPAAGAAARVRAATEEYARTFLALEPAARSLDEETIRRANAAILETDRHEVDGAVYPNNSFRFVPFRPEVERYGGRRRFRVSLDYFTLSSVAALDFLLRLGAEARPAQLAQAFRLLLRQALAFAVDGAELSDLLRYGVDWLGHDLPKVVAKADRVAASQMDRFLAALGETVDEVRGRRPRGASGARPADLLVAGGQRLSAAIGTAERATRVRIGGSQLHLTASRLGLGNAEEVYLSHLLTLTLDEARAAGGTDLSWLGEAAVRWAGEEPAEAVGRLLPSALEALTKLPACSAEPRPPG
jgi:hypothetical protein